MAQESKEESKESLEEKKEEEDDDGQGAQSPRKMPFVVERWNKSNGDVQKFKQVEHFGAVPYASSSIAII